MRWAEGSNVSLRRCPGLKLAPRPDVTPPSAWSFANDGLRAALGYVPHTRMEDGIDAMLAAISAR